MLKTKNTLLKAATCKPSKQSLQESIFSPTIKNLKNKTSLQHNQRQTITLTSYNIIQMDCLTRKGQRRASANSLLFGICIVSPRATTYFSAPKSC